MGCQLYMLLGLKLGNALTNMKVDTYIKLYGKKGKLIHILETSMKRTTLVSDSFKIYKLEYMISCIKVIIITNK